MFLFPLLLVLINCAYSSDKFKPILTAKIEDFPYHVSIYETSYDIPVYLCSGALHRRNAVITSAFCVENRPAGILAVHAGSADRKARPNKYPVKKVIFHPGVDWYTTESIAILILTYHYPNSTKIHPIEIAQDDEITFEHQGTTISSWVKMFGRSEHSQMLKTWQLIAIPSRECNSINGVHDDTFCCFAFDACPDACPSSGDPLVIELEPENGSEPVQKLLGIASFNSWIECDNGFATRFIKIPYFANWINSTVETFP